MKKSVLKPRKCPYVEIDNSEAFKIAQVSPAVQVMYERKMDRMLAVLDETIRKTKIALCMPIMVRNKGALIRRFLTPEEMNVVFQGCSKYPPPQPTGGPEKPSLTMAPYRTDGSLEKCPQPLERWQQALGDLYKVSSMGMKCRNDPNLARALYIIEQNADLMDAIELNLSFLVHPSSKVLLENLSRLRSCVADRLKVGPVEAIYHEKDLRRHWAEGDEFPTKLAGMQGQLDVQRRNLGAEVATKAREIARLRAAITNTRRQCQDDIRFLVNSSERSMVYDSRNNDHRTNMLNAELKGEQDKLAAMQTEHLKEEKELRTKKHKIETLLVTWLQKFDTEIGDKQAEFDQLTTDYAQEQIEHADLQTQLAEMEEEFLRLQEEKEGYEQADEDELVYRMKCIWAARVIQRFWRDYIARKKLRRKGKKGKGKKKPPSEDEADRKAVKTGRR